MHFCDCIKIAAIYSVYAYFFVFYSLQNFAYIFYFIRIYAIFMRLLFVCLSSPKIDLYAVFLYNVTFVMHIVSQIKLYNFCIFKINL